MPLRLLHLAQQWAHVPACPLAHSTVRLSQRQVNSDVHVPHEVPQPSTPQLLAPHGEVVWHAPFVHVWHPMHVDAHWPLWHDSHAPQVETQAPPLHVSHAPHPLTHVPPLHDSHAPHVEAHAPWEQVSHAPHVD